MPLDAGGTGGEGPVRAAPRRFQDIGAYDPAPDREETRSWLAKALVLLLAAVSLALIACVATELISVDAASDLALAVLSPLVALTGAALGFYFGGEHERAGGR